MARHSRLIGKRETESSGCSAAPATVRTPFNIHCESGKDIKATGVLSRETYHRFRKAFSEGGGSKQKTVIRSFVIFPLCLWQGGFNFLRRKI